MSTTADQVAALDAQGIPTTRIAAQLGITQSRVEWILDTMAGATVTAPIPGTPRVARFAFTTGAIAVSKPRAAPVVVEPKQPRGSVAKPIKHGTPYGYKAHKKRGEDPCDRCSTAYRDYSRGWSQENRPRKDGSLMPAKPVLSEIGHQVVAERVRVQWLVPPHGQDTTIEYAIRMGDKLVEVNPDTAVLHADQGEILLARRVTPWQPIPHTGEVAS